MNKLCSQNYEDSSSVDESYVRGYNINYSSGSSQASGSNPDFLSTVFDKTASPKSKSMKVIETENEALKESSGSGVSRDTIKDRCRIAYECRNNMICIEGNRAPKKKQQSVKNISLSKS